jgi:ArsR family transcriptional regulator, virulence genes transcriptional regulator
VTPAQNKHLDIAKLEKQAAHAAAVLKSISNKWRLLVLCQLVKGEKSVGEILDRVELSQSALSQHLAVLRESGLVNTRRESQAIFYSLRGDEAQTILTTLYDLFCKVPSSASASMVGAPKKRAKG